MEDKKELFIDILRFDDTRILTLTSKDFSTVKM